MTFGKLKLIDKDKVASTKRFYIGLIVLVILAVISAIAIGALAANSCQEPKLVKDYTKLQNSKDIVIQNDGYLIFKGPIDDVVKINLQKSEGGSQIIYCFDYEDDCPVGCQDVDDVCVLDRSGNILYKDNFFWGHADEIPETRVDVKAGDVLKINAYTIWYLGLEVWGEECYTYACDFNQDCGVDGWINGLFCSNNDVYQDYQTFICGNPGSVESFCSNPINSLFKSDCGEDEYTNNSCYDGDVYKDFTDRGCSSGACFVTTTKQKMQECGINECSNNQCNPPSCQDECSAGQNRCSGNSRQTCGNYDDDSCLEFGGSADCGEDYCGAFGENYCSSLSGDVYHSRICYDKGCSTESCFDNQSTDEQLVQDCSYGCLLGQCLFEPPAPVIECNNNAECDDEDSGTEDLCVNPGTEDSYCTNEPYYENILCTLNTDCGTNDWINQPICSNGNVVQEYKTFTCENAGTSQSECSSVSNPQLKQPCQYGCSNGTCLPQPAQCTTNSDCNSLDNYSEGYCSSGDVYKDFNDYSCAQGSCVKSTSRQLDEECDSDETCSAGECEEDNKDNNDNNGDNTPVSKPSKEDSSLLEPLSQWTGQNRIYLAPEIKEETKSKISNLWIILIWIFGALIILFLILIFFYSRRR